MVIYKAFGKGLICRGYQFQMGMNVTEKANCVQNGFHGAENPVDCFRHYTPSESSEDEYYMCEASGDMDEDDVDSKVSCTHLNIVRRLSLYDMATCALLFMLKHPEREFREYNNTFVAVMDMEAIIQRPGIAIARGRAPVAAGPLGATLGFAELGANGTVAAVKVVRVDGEKIKPHIRYVLRGGELFET